MLQARKNSYHYSPICLNYLSLLGKQALSGSTTNMMRHIFFKRGLTLSNGVFRL